VDFIGGIPFGSILRTPLTGRKVSCKPFLDEGHNINRYYLSGKLNQLPFFSQQMDEIH
jgi:hypothetical protein